jgi:hypothetical protein
LVKIRAAVLNVGVDSVGLGAARVLALVVDGPIAAKGGLIVLAILGLLVEQLIVRTRLSLDLVVLAVEVALKYKIKII